MSWGEIYNTSWWGVALDTARTVKARPDFFGSQLNLLTSEQDNLVTNGDFSDGLNNWTINTNALGYVSTSSETLQYLTGHGDYAEVKQLNNSVIGKKYKSQFEIISKGINATVFIQYGRSYIYSGDISNLDLGIHTFEVVSTHPDGFSISVRTNGVIEIDNVSVQVVRAELDQIEAKKCLADWIHTTALKDLNN